MVAVTATPSIYAYKRMCRSYMCRRARWVHDNPWQANLLSILLQDGHQGNQPPERSKFILRVRKRPALLNPSLQLLLIFTLEPLKSGISESLFFKDTGGWSPDHFHDRVHIRLPSSYSAWKSGSSKVMATQIGVPCWGNLTTPEPDMAIPPSPSSRSYLSNSLSTTRVRTATGSPLPIPIRTTLTP